MSESATLGQGVVMHVLPVVRTSLVLFASFAVFGQTGPQRSEGVRVRSGPADYSAQTKAGGTEIAATVLSADLVKHAFAYDISKQYVVIEIAIFPGTKDSLAVREGDFSIHPPAKLDVIRQAEPETVAADIQNRNTPRHTGRSVPVYGEVNVGYETGTDPDTGRRGHGTYTGVGVGVGGPPAPTYPTPGGYPQDRALLEDQLFRKSLPEGAMTKPVAGYLYFPLSELKSSKGSYDLEFRSDDPHQQAVTLSVPARAK